MLPTKLAQKIYERRKTATGTMSLRVASTSSGVSSSTLCRLEKGKQPDRISITLLATWLEVPTSTVIDWANTNAETE